MNWQSVSKEYLTFLKIERGFSKNTVDGYGRDLKKLSDYLIACDIHISPFKIEEVTIQEFIYNIAKEMSPRSQARLISGLKNFFSYLVFEGYRETNPTDLIEAPKIGRKLPDTLSEEEIDTLIKAVDLSHPQGERNRTIIETIYSCGLRVSELITLKLSDLFFEEGYIRVIGKGNKQRFIPIHSNAQKYLLSYIRDIRVHVQPKKGFEDTVFLNRNGRGLSRQMIFILLRDLALSVNLTKKIGPHTLRHSFATHLLKNGADLRSIQQMLGHESIVTTEIYVHLDKNHLKDVVETYHPRRHI
ncbi:MAG: site-specific tyrosine recombinase XerD [Flavobacteriaceae bacterium]|nr:MAG: site-specific tyrosine recombinase XerD [Flavobacteriaceae bacterium]